MFKNLMLFRIEGGPETAVDLAEQIKAEQFAPCGATQQKATGWVPPREAEGALAELVNGQIIAKFVIETKAVPGDALREKVDELAQAIESSTGRRPGKRERKDLRDDALQELLPHAFPRRSAHFVWIDPDTRLLVVDAGSLRQADEITSSLTRVAAQGFALKLIQTNQTPQSLMTDWLASDDWAHDFRLGRSLVLKGDGEQPSTARFSKHALDTDEVRFHLADKLPISLALSWKDRVDFTLTDAMQIKGVAFDDAVFDGSDDYDADRFDTDVTIKTAELQQMLSDLLACLGCEAHTPF